MTSVRFDEWIVVSRPSKQSFVDARFIASYAPITWTADPALAAGHRTKAECSGAYEAVRRSVVMSRRTQRRAAARAGNEAAIGALIGEEKEPPVRTDAYRVVAKRLRELVETKMPATRRHEMLFALVRELEGDVTVQRSRDQQAGWQRGVPGDGPIEDHSFADGAAAARKELIAEIEAWGRANLGAIEYEYSSLARLLARYGAAPKR